MCIDSRGSAEGPFGLTHSASGAQSGLDALARDLGTVPNSVFLRWIDSTLSVNITRVRIN